VPDIARVENGRRHFHTCAVLILVIDLFSCVVALLLEFPAMTDELRVSRAVTPDRWVRCLAAALFVIVAALALFALAQRLG
jgi:hypothetical protein